MINRDFLGVPERSQFDQPKFQKIKPDPVVRRRKPLRCEWRWKPIQYRTHVLDRENNSFGFLDMISIIQGGLDKHIKTPRTAAVSWDASSITLMKSLLISFSSTSYLTLNYSRNPWTRVDYRSVYRWETGPSMAGKRQEDLPSKAQHRSKCGVSCS